MYVQPLESQLAPAALAAMGNEQENAQPLGSAMAPALGEADAISRFVEPLAANGMMQPMQTSFFGPLAGLIQQLMQMLSSMTGYGGYGGCGYGGSGGCVPYGGEQFFANANGASTGDPHLSFNGNHWNSMASQPDLLDSDSIPGGFRVSTQVTAPNSRGITWNQSATVALNGGQTTVSMNNAGQASIESYGRSIPIAEGQTLQLGNGASVTCNQNGSLSIVAQNGSGGRIATTLTAQGEGVNVEANAQNVDLGGALVAGQGQPPVYGPIPGPIGGPILDPFPPITGTPVTTPPVSGSPIFAPQPPVRLTPF